MHRADRTATDATAPVAPDRRRCPRTAPRRTARWRRTDGSCIGPNDQARQDIRARAAIDKPPRLNPRSARCVEHVDRPDTVIAASGTRRPFQSLGRSDGNRATIAFRSMSRPAQRRWPWSCVGPDHGRAHDQAARRRLMWTRIAGLRHTPVQAERLRSQDRRGSTESADASVSAAQAEDGDTVDRAALLHGGFMSPSCAQR